MLWIYNLKTILYTLCGDTHKNVGISREKKTHKA